MLKALFRAVKKRFSRKDIVKMTEPNPDNQAGKQSSEVKSAKPIQAPDQFVFSFCVEQKPGEGEDSEPLIHISQSRDRGFLGVFDGMGGAGGKIHSYKDIKHTGAYIASRLASAVVRDFFVRFVNAEHSTLDAETTVKVAHNLHARLEEAFKAEVAKLGEPSARLAGKMIRRLPTTMACLYFEIVDADPQNATYSLFWAGDSRCYLLSPNDGLQQASIDDLRSGADALQNLLDDSPVSNCINADSDFVVNAITARSRLPIIFLTATDGCFNYGASPAHFEFALLDCLMQSSNSEDWGERVKNRLYAIAGDDLSIALVSLGWSDFTKLKAAYGRRAAELSSTFIKPLDDIDDSLNQINEHQKQLLAKRDKLRLNLWNEYRKGYELFHDHDASTAKI